MTNPSEETTQPADEQGLYELLCDYLRGMDMEDGNRHLDPEGDYAFVLTAFNRPANSDDDVTAVDAVVMQVYPSLSVDETTGMVHSIQAKAAGVHVLCNTILAKLLTEHAVNTVVEAAQNMAVKGQVRRND